MTKAPALADAALVAYLRDFYSIGQLEIIYCTLTDGKPLPNMGETERALRITAIETILGKNQSVAPAKPPKDNAHKTRK